MIDDNNTIEYNISLLGDSSVGKTCLFKKLTTGVFMEKLISTIGVDKKSFNLDIEVTENQQKVKKLVNISLVDTAGQERFRTITKSYFKGSDGIILMYDVSNKKSFFGIKKWISDIKEATNINEIGFIVVANKSDIAKEEWEVDEEMKQKLMETENIKIMEVSAKNNINIDESIVNLVDSMIKLGVGKKSWGNDEDDDDDNSPEKTHTLNNKKKKNKDKGCCGKKSK